MSTAHHQLGFTPLSSALILPTVFASLMPDSDSDTFDDFGFVHLESVSNSRKIIKGGPGYRIRTAQKLKLIMEAYVDDGSGWTGDLDEGHGLKVSNTLLCR